MQRLIKIGEIEPKKSSEIKNSRIGIGFEKLDRAVFEPEKAYDLIAGIGIKYARIQSGWMRTEKEKGKYCFEWIDSIVDNLLARGIEPWINLVYGNPLYTEIANDFFGAVGCPPLSAEALNAWLTYVKALALHMNGRVNKFEIWNEPDGGYSWKTKDNLTGTKGVPSGREYGEFAKATAAALREVKPDAYIIGFALAKPKSLGFTKQAMDTGLGNLIDAASYHCYMTDTSARVFCHNSFASLVHSYNPELDIIQGESGTQSRYGHAGALKNMNWTPEKQTKHLLRLMITDLGLDCSIVSYFSAMDMVEALNGLMSDKKTYLDYGYFGVISADFDENGVSTGEYSKKPSYYALQNLASLFEGDIKPEIFPLSFSCEKSAYVNGSDYTGNELMYYTFRLSDGSSALAYWKNTDILTSSFDGTTTVELLASDVPELIDLRDGSIYSFPENMIADHDGATQLKNIPLRDYPLIIRFR